MEQDWYFERRNGKLHLAPIVQITQNFDYVLRQAREAVEAGERFHVRPSADASSRELAALAEAGPIDIHR